MTRPDHPATPAPKARTDSTRPPRTRPTTRRGDRQPSSSAPVRAASSRLRTRRAGAPRRPAIASSAPIPATVWACGTAPIDPDATWPTPILTKIVAGFSGPGDHTVLLAWPSTPPNPTQGPVRADGASTASRRTGPDDEWAIALTAIADLGRSAQALHVDPDPRASAAAAGLSVQTGNADLIITSLRPERSDNDATDPVALLAARLLRLGGILAVLTHSDWSRGELFDPTGAVVAAAQNADLLYLQHLVVLHTPIHRGELLCQPHGAADVEPARVRHSAQLRRLPEAHRRIHSDVLVFTQPHDHEPSPLAPETVTGTTVLR